MGIEYSFRNLSTSSSDNSIIEIFESREEQETGKLNWRAGFNYNKKLAKKLYLKSGLRLASVGYKDEKRTGLTWPSEHDGMGGWTPDPNLYHESQLVHDYWFIELPIAGRFEFSDKKFSPFIEIGVSPSMYLTTRVSSITDIGTDNSFEKNELSTFNKMHLVGNFSIGFNYLLTEQLQFFGQPIIRYHLTKLYDDALIESHLFNYGMEVGIRRKLN
jgi:hypothetical protein